MFRRPRAFTLIELAIYSGLLGFLMTGLYLITRGGLHYYRTSVAYQSVQQQALIAMSKMTAELANSDFKTVDWEPSTAATSSHIKFLSPDQYLDPSQSWEYDAAGKLLWRKWVLYRRLPNQQLTRAELKPQPNPPGTPLTLPTTAVAPLLTAFPGSSSPAWRVLAKGVQTLSFSKFGTDSISIELETRQETASNKASFVRLRNTVRMENQS